MSYAFDLLFVKQPFATEGDAMVYAANLVSKLVSSPDLAKEQIRAHPNTIRNRLRMAGLRWDTIEERKEAMRTEKARLAIESAAETIFSLRFIYWRQHKLLAIVGDCVPDEVKQDFVLVSFQNSTDQDYSFDEWCNEIPLFRNKKLAVLAMSQRDLRKKLQWASDSDLEYVRRSYLYSCIFDALCLENWLYDPDREESPFSSFRLTGITSQERMLHASMAIRSFIQSEFAFSNWL